MRKPEILLIGIVAIGACSPQPVATGTFSATPTPVPGPTLSPTPTRAGTGLGDCGAIPNSDCEAAWAAATDFGLDPKVVPRIVGWQARPTTVKTCGGYLVPKFDVTFHLDTGADVAVTVGQRPDGRLEACTY